MNRYGQCVIFLEPDDERRQTLRSDARDLRLRLIVCAAIDEALSLLASRGARAVVVACDGHPGAVIALLLAARAHVPPAEIVVLTDDPRATRAELRRAGVIAEVLRRQTTIPQLTARLGLGPTTERAEGSSR